MITIKIIFSILVIIIGLCWTAYCINYCGDYFKNGNKTKKTNRRNR